MRALIPLLLCAVAHGAQHTDEVTRTKGLVVFWDGSLKPHGGDFPLEPSNYVRDYFSAGRDATLTDFPIVDGGPFGKAVEFRDEKDRDFRPVLLVPRARLHNTRLDVKGPGKSVSMVVWLKRTAGNHAIAGIWHEGTDMGGGVTRVEPGMRQYALFAGLAANNGAAAVHVSDNGARSFGDKYARQLAVTPEKIPDGWCAVGFVFDNKRDTVTAYLDGKATEYWIENPEKHPFFQYAARAFAAGQWRPPKKYVKVRDGKLVALKANPYWFPHDIHSPPSGGPFTIGRVIHTSRNVGFVGLIGGVAVFDRALSRKDMERLARIR